jgi:methylmalonyl-CoA mutase cobalamin-binding subunit
LRDAGHDVEIYDINCLRYDKVEAVRNAPHGDFDWVGVSGLITTYNYLCFLIPMLRKIYLNTPIVIGGGGITSAPKMYMENLRPNYGVIGEGEYTALELSSGHTGEVAK